MILGQNMFHVIRPLKYFTTEQEDTPMAVRFPLGWVLRRPLHSISGLLFTGFKAIIKIESDFKLAEQTRSWYNMECFGT